jgi:hypothetical protein
VLAAALACGLAPAAAAQGRAPLVLGGRVVRVAGNDSVPVAGQVVVAHHVTPAVQGAVDSARSDAAGRFRIVVARPATDGVYMVSTKYRGIGYFGVPVADSERVAAGRLTLAVFDTSSSGHALFVAMRHLVVTAPEGGGTRRILDIVQVENPGTTTRVASDSTGATWRMRLAPGVTDFQLGESDISPAAVRREGDVVLISAPFPPGAKQVLLSYSAPAGAQELIVPIDQVTARLEVMVEGGGVSASGAGVRAAEPMAIDTRSFTRYTAEGVDGGASLTLTFGSGGARGSYVWVIVLVAGVALGAGAFVLLRRRRADQALAAAPRPDTSDALVAQIAALDERFEGREAATPPAEWARYTTRRADLKERLRAVLAQGGAA